MKHYLFLAVTLAGCATAPQIKQPDTGIQPPEAWQTEVSTTAPSDTLWWTSFNDPQLDSLVFIALQQNHNLQVTASRVNAAQAQAKIAGASRLPQIGAGFQGARSKKSVLSIPPGTPNPSNAYGLSLNASWEIDLWNQLGSTQAAALANLQANKAIFRGAQMSLAAQTTKTWFAVVEAKRQLELAEATYHNNQTSYDQVRTRYERGVRPSLDVRLSLSDLSSSEDRLYQRRQQVDATVRQLDVLLGYYPSGKRTIETDLPQVPGPIPAGLPADLISRRPDLVAAERRLAATHASLVSARRALYPRISLTASGGTASNQLGDLLDGNFSIWSLVGNITQPLFQGGRIRGNIDLAKAQSDEAVASYAQSVLQAYAEVENALSAEAYLAQRQTALETAAEQALAARQLAEDRYNRGLTDLITMLQAQRTAYLTESQLLTVRRQRLDARIDLHLALGGGFPNVDAILSTNAPSGD